MRFRSESGRKTANSQKRNGKCYFEFCGSEENGFGGDRRRRERNKRENGGIQGVRVDDMMEIYLVKDKCICQMLKNLHDNNIYNDIILYIVIKIIGTAMINSSLFRRHICPHPSLPSDFHQTREPT